MKKKTALIATALTIYLIGWPLLCYQVLQGANAVADAANIHTVKWIEKAASAGNIEAQEKVGAYYRDGYRTAYYGELVPQNKVQAYLWYSLAARSGNKQAKKELADLEITMTKEQVKNGATLLHECKPDFGSK